ncbi:MAG: cyclodeaminase/cyclohydrolase family protein [Candidatus Omnitrophota bacterium]
MFVKKSIQSYIETLASRKPIPGGGSVCALSGTLGVGLLLMVVNFTLGKESYKCHFREISVMLKRLTRLKERLTGLIDRDSQTYLFIVKAYKLPKDTTRKEALRKKKIQEALKKSTAVTLEILIHSAQALTMSKRLLDIGNKNLISDVGVGAVMLESAIKGALLNIEINLAGIKDNRFSSDIQIKVKNIVDEAKKVAYEVITHTSERIANK